MTKPRREEMRALREAAMKVEQRLDERRMQGLIADMVDNNHIPNRVPDPPEDCDETFTSETLPTDIPTSAPVAVPQPVTPPSLIPIDVLLSPSPEQTPVIPKEAFSAPKLIRSNSYTLDHPSPMLLKFLDTIASGVVTTSSTSNKKGKSKLSKSACSTPKTPSPGNRKKTPRKLSDPSARARNSLCGMQTPSPARKSKSESLDNTKRRLKIHSRGEQVEKYFMKSKTVKDFENLTQREPIQSEQHSILTLDIEPPESEKEKAEETNPKKQNEEFNRQQMEKHRLLVHQIGQLNINTVDRTSTPVNSQSEQEEGEGDDPQQILDETSFYSTIRGDSPVCSMSLVSDAYSKQYLQSIRAFIGSPTSVSVHQQEHEEIAATIINSHVRGYLIRRLLRTEFVQSIIENIKNILFLILDSNPKDIQLKRTYLVQLNGNCERLHDVFFKYTTRERMQVISKDREMLLQRLSQRRRKKELPFVGGRISK